MDFSRISEEQVRRIREYVRRKSERLGKELGEEEYIEWIRKHARRFRYIADHLNDKCIECGYCKNPQKGKDCIAPFNQTRRLLLRKRRLNK